MKKTTTVGAVKKRRPDPECQRDDLRNQSFYHVGVEYYQESTSEAKTTPSKTKATRSRKSS